MSRAYSAAVLPSDSSRNGLQGRPKLFVGRREITSGHPSFERGRERADRVFNKMQFRALHTALPADLADFVLFGCLSSWRKNEIATLKWSDIEKNTIHLRAENANDRPPRTLPIAGAELIELIERRKEARLVDGSTFSVFALHRDGEPIREFRKAWALACKKVKLEGKLFHDLWRSAVVNLIGAGVPVVTAMSLGGHTTFSLFVGTAFARKKSRTARWKRCRNTTRNNVRKLSRLHGN
jgi:integrase